MTESGHGSRKGNYRSSHGSKDDTIQSIANQDLGTNRKGSKQMGSNQEGLGWHKLEGFKTNGFEAIRVRMREPGMWTEPEGFETRGVRIRNRGVHELGLERTRRISASSKQVRVDNG
ncbi:hypothetical protein U1Q18_013275 [Sarracenia purpurea var. burkii]